MPSIAKDCFVAAQTSSFQFKNQRASKIICEFHELQNQTFTPEGLFQILAKTLTRLSVLWGFRDHCHILADHIANDILNSFSFRDRMSLLVHQNQNQINRATAIGILWNRAVRRFSQTAMAEAASSVVSSNDPQDDETSILEECFSELSDGSLDILEDKLSNYGFEKTLADEFAGVTIDLYSSKLISSPDRIMGDEINGKEVVHITIEDNGKKLLTSSSNEVDDGFDFSSNQDMEENRNDNSSDIVKEGFLTKQGGFIHNWKERYFILTQSTLSYYRVKVCIHFFFIKIIFLLTFYIPKRLRIQEKWLVLLNFQELNFYDLLVLLNTLLKYQMENELILFNPNLVKIVKLGFKLLEVKYILDEGWKGFL